MAKKQEQPNPLQPSPSLLAKLGSIIVHVDEMSGITGHHFDARAIKMLLEDPEVRDWLTAMGKISMIPLKRTLEDLKLAARRQRSESR